MNSRMILRGATIFTLFLLFVLVLYSNGASAHVLIPANEDNTKAAIFHIKPNDDPRPNQSSELIFDLDGFDPKINKNDYKAILLIENTVLPVSMSDGMATAKYSFSRSGSFLVRLKVIDASGHSYTFDQDVSVHGDGANEKKHFWQAFALALFGFLMIVLSIVFAIHYRVER